MPVLEAEAALTKLRGVADYQFGRGAGEALFPRRVQITLSPTTKRIRHVFLDGKLLATLRPADGLLSLTVAGGQRLAARLKPPRLRVVVSDEVQEFIREGRSVFAKHVVEADREIRPRQEVVVVNSRDEVLAVGRAVLSGEEMACFRRGVAVKVRHGARPAGRQA